MVGGGEQHATTHRKGYLGYLATQNPTHLPTQLHGGRGVSDAANACLDVVAVSGKYFDCLTPGWQLTGNFLVRDP